jgi:hypothetical protein
MVTSLRSRFFSRHLRQKLLLTYMDCLHRNAVGKSWEGFPGISPRAKGPVGRVCTIPYLVGQNRGILYVLHSLDDSDMEGNELRRVRTYVLWVSPIRCGKTPAEWV